MSPVARTRAAALLPAVLFAVLMVMATQLVAIGTGSAAPPAVLGEPAPAVSAMLMWPGNSAPSPSAAPALAAPAPVAAAPAPAPAPTTTITATTTAPPVAAPLQTPAPAAAVTSAAAAAVATATPAAAPADSSAPTQTGEATTWGCAAALSYLQAHAAQGFTFECPGYAEGHEAMTCLNTEGVCPSSAVIAIADPCPEAYMNEASNSYVITGVADTPIDPYGACPSS